MKSLFAMTIALVTFADGTQAACPYLGDGGCAAAPPKGSFLQPSFYAYATNAAAMGSGQTWSGGSHPWYWNAAGVDYAVGYPTGTPLQDVYQATFKGAGSRGVLPAACSFETANTVPKAPYARIYCQQVSGGDITIQGLNFQSAYLGGDCVVLEIATSVTGGGTIHIIGNNFHNGPNCNWGPNNFMVKIDGGTDNVLFEDNQVDGTYAAYNNTYNQVAMVVANGSGNFTAEYNAVLNAPQRPFATSTPGVLTFDYNYINTIVKYAGLEHGEIDENGATSNQTEQTYLYNTILIPNTQGPSTDTSVFYCNGGNVFAGWILVNCKVDHNVVVTNLNAGAVTTDAAALEIANLRYINVTFTNNYVDGTGSLVCNNNTSGTASGIAGSIGGNYMYISSLQPNSIITSGLDVTGNPTYIVSTKPGQTIRVYTAIQRQLSGTPGGVGYYIVSGSQKVNFTSAATENAPIMGSLSWFGNVSLVSGKAIPTADWSKACP